MMCFVVSVVMDAIDYSEMLETEECLDFYKSNDYVMTSPTQSC